MPAFGSPNKPEIIRLRLFGFQFAVAGSGDRNLRQIVARAGIDQTEETRNGSGIELVEGRLEKSLRGARANREARAKRMIQKADLRHRGRLVVRHVIFVARRDIHREVGHPRNILVRPDQRELRFRVDADDFAMVVGDCGRRATDNVTGVIQRIGRLRQRLHAIVHAQSCTDITGGEREQFIRRTGQKRVSHPRCIHIVDMHAGVSDQLLIIRDSVGVVSKRIIRLRGPDVLRVVRIEDRIRGI